MSVDCRRWIELTDLEALGEPVPSDERAFLRAHEASCVECGREAAIWRAVKAPETDLAPAEDEVERVLALAAAERASRSPIALPQRWKGAALLGSAVACAAAVVLWLSGTFERDHTTDRDKLARAPAPITSTLGQSPASGGAVPSTPSEAAAEPHCSRVVAGVTVCLARGAAITRRALEGADRELELARGRAVVSLAPQPPGTSFSLTTARGKVTAVGTIFSVEVDADGSTVARVLEGHVSVRAGHAGSAHSVRAGQAFRLGEQQPTSLLDQDRDLDLALLALSGSIEHETSERPSAVKPSEPGVAPTAPRDTLEYARSLRASGEVRRAADVYRRIYATNPQSPSGRAALVSLGELLLSLDDAGGALKAFDSYLGQGGGLAQEAAFGRARALRALNRPAEERRAIEHFLAAYPDAPQSRVLRSRLAAIQK